MRKEAKILSKSILKPTKNIEEKFQVTKLDILNYGFPESKCKKVKF